jgi:hypothetical protein
MTDPRLEAVPPWALEILATDDVASRTRDGIIDLSPSHDERLAHQARYPVRRTGQLELLRPFQIEFRRLLTEFSRARPSGAIVVEIASQDSEFHRLYENLRYVPMDLSGDHLRYAKELGRIHFGVVADIRQPPLRPRSVDAIISTNTLNHLPGGAVPEVVDRLLGALKIAGRAVLTVKADRVAPITDRIAGRFRVVASRGFDGPTTEVWNSAVVPSIRRVQRIPLPSRYEHALIRTLNMVARGTAVLESRVLGPKEAVWRNRWLEIERIA